MTISSPNIDEGLARRRQAFLIGTSCVAPALEPTEKSIAYINGQGNLTLTQASDEHRDGIIEIPD